MINKIKAIIMHSEITVKLDRYRDLKNTTNTRRKNF